MNVIYFVLVVIGSIVLGFALGFLVFTFQGVILNWILKRKLKKQTDKDLCKPLKKPTEKEVTNDSNRYNEFRQFEKLRAIESGKYEFTNSNRTARSVGHGEGGSELSFKPSESPKLDKPKFKLD